MQGIVSTACRGSLFPRKNDLPRPSPRDPFYGLVFYRLSASHSLIKGYNLYAYPAREHFCSAKSAQKRFRAAALKTRNAWLRWIRILIFCCRRKSNPYGTQMRSRGSLRRLVGRNLSFNRTAPSLCYGQSSPLRCALLSPQGLATLRGPP